MKKLQAIGLTCINAPSGCEWEGTVGTLANHLERYCSNWKCKDCGMKGTHIYISVIHHKKCKKKKVPCPNADCTLTVQRRGIKRHLEDCAHTEVPCKYKHIGCKIKLARKDIEEHESELKPHFDLALHKISLLENR